MTCHEAQALLPDYATENLAAVVIEDLETHLAACPSCAAEFSRLRATWETLGRLPEEEPRGTLRARFDAMLAQEMRRSAGERASRHGTAGSGGRWRGGARAWLQTALPARWPRRLLPQLGLALLLMAIGVALGWRLRPDSEVGDLALLRSEVQQLRTEIRLGRLSGASAVGRLAAVSDLRQAQQLPSPVLESLFGALATDPNVNVRLAVVDALADHLDLQVVRDGFYQLLGSQTSPIVQIAMIEALVYLDDPQGQQIIRELAVDDRIDPTVRLHVRRRIGHRL